MESGIEKNKALRAPDERPFGSRPRTRLQRWQDQRTQCLPRYCMYAQDCPEGGRQGHYVAVQRCYRFRPEDERPPERLSWVALQALARIREGGAGTRPPAAPIAALDSAPGRQRPRGGSG